MDDLDAIQASLTSFTKHLDEVYAGRFNELRKCSFFDPIPSEWLKPIAEHAEIRAFSAGDRLISEEDEDMKAFYVLLFGSTTVYRNRKEIGKINSGECVGEGMFFADQRISRSASVIADGEVIAAEINKAGIDHLHGDAIAKAYIDKALLLALFRKLQGANRKIEELLR
jgi:CRP-like cAMP-binding protein